MTLLLFQPRTSYSSGSTLLLFGYGKILARLARGVKPTQRWAARRIGNEPADVRAGRLLIAWNSSNGLLSTVAPRWRDAAAGDKALKRLGQRLL